MGRSLAADFTKGLWNEIPPLRLVLGLCPTLAVTKSGINGLGMGLATLFVLVCSSSIISSLKNVIPKKIRIAAYIVVIATFVVIVELLMQAFAYPVYESLGIFIPLIVVNCIILGRAEAFASKNSVIRSAADGLGMGMGFTLSLFTIGSIRELIGNGTFLGKAVMFESYQPFKFMVEAPGAFVCLGLILALMNLQKAKSS